MTELHIGIAAIVCMLAGIYFGMHIGIALIATSFVSVWLIKSPEVAARFVAASANDAIRDYLFGVIPLFVLMGMLVSVSGVGRDTFDVFQWLLRRIRGGLGLATVAANAVFAAITGISIASASVFTKVAVPEMIRHGYTPRFSVGVVAGSSVLGMLIPPSLLMIIYGVLAEESIGRMFIAGIIPGALLALGFCVLIVGMAWLVPHKVGTPEALAGVGAGIEETPLSAAKKFVPILLLITLVLGGLYAGFFTPTEAGAVGAAGALTIALVRGRLTWRKLWQVLVETGYVSVSVLFLIIAAMLYSRMLALTGMPSAVTEGITHMGLGPWGFLFMYVLIVADHVAHRAADRARLRHGRGVVRCHHRGGGGNWPAHPALRRVGLHRQIGVERPAHHRARHLRRQFSVRADDGRCAVHPGRISQPVDLAGLPLRSTHAVHFHPHRQARRRRAAHRRAPAAQGVSRGGGRTHRVCRAVRARRRQHHARQPAGDRLSLARCGPRLAGR